MARLTTFSRLLIILAILAGVFFAVKKFLPQFSGGGSEATQTETSASTASGENSTAQPSTGTATTVGGDASAGRPFTFTPPAPAGGKLKGVVELGATGFNSFIVRIDGQKNWKLEKSEFGSSLVHENMATEDDVKNGLKRYIQKMLDYGVSGKDIHFVVSSGAKKAEVTQKIINGLRSLNYVANEVTPEQEGKYALKCVQPRGFEGKSFVVDIGSGNTKIVWSSGFGVTALESPGAKYFQDGKTDGDVYQDVSGKAKQIPANLRETCFIIGGVPFELAKQTRNGSERFTVLKGPGGYTADGAKQKAGLNIYKAIAEGTGCKQFVFDWDANFTIGFLLTL
ncbi:MAG: hypothetical protein ACK4Q5_15200 [Saprospiraceae bacterium]